MVLLSALISRARVLFCPQKDLGIAATITNFLARKMNTNKLPNRLGYKWLFSLTKTLVYTTILLSQGINFAQAAPQSLRTDVKVRNITNTLSPSASPSVRIAKNPRNNTLYYLKRNGEIYQVNLATGTSTLVYNSNNHHLTNTPGMAIGPNGTIYLVGMTDVGNSRNKATVVKGIINSVTGQRGWSTLAETAGYPKSNTAFDHGFDGIVVSPNGAFIYVGSGSRTDHGEVQAAGGLFPNTREVGLTACIFRLPTSGQNIFLPNNRATLKAKGYIFAEGLRHTFDMAFAPNGDLFGPENGPDRDMPEELNWLRSGSHYGFPWRIGGLDNPQQFSNYIPADDQLLDPRFYAVKNGFYRNDPTFPTRPNRTLTEPIPNFGPHADSFRDPLDRIVKDASVLRQSLSTFTSHRSPLGLVFDVQKAMSPEFLGDGFMLSWAKGDPTGETVQGPFKDPSQDLLHLDLTKIGTTNYQIRATRIVRGFTNPIDAEIIQNKIYVLEYGGNQGIWEVTMPPKTVL